MKTKIMTGIAGLLLASSTMFAGWGVSVGVGGGYYGPRGGFYAGPAPVYRYWRPHYVAPVPYVAVAPAPYYAPDPYVDTYVGPPPFYGAVWVPGRWTYGRGGRYWVRGYWCHRR